jgi:hypothetical protein
MLAEVHLDTYYQNFATYTIDSTPPLTNQAYTLSYDLYGGMDSVGCSR